MYGGWLRRTDRKSSNGKVLSDDDDDDEVEGISLLLRARCVMWDRAPSQGQTRASLRRIQNNGSPPTGRNFVTLFSGGFY